MNELHANLHRRLTAFTSLQIASLRRRAIVAGLQEIGSGLRV